jgi:hypothetical protein
MLIVQFWLSTLNDLGGDIMASPSPLLAIAQRLGLPHVKVLAKEVGVKNVFRITAQHPSRHARNSVATLIQSRLQPAQLQILYEGFLNNQPITRTLEEHLVALLFTRLAEAKFDHLPDQPSPNTTMTLWLLERASGSFYTSVVLSPYRVEAPYSRLVNALDDTLPEAIREVSPP